MIKIVSVNIEGARHLDLVRGFLEIENPEVIFLQEAFENDANFFAKHFGMEMVYAPMTVRPRNDGMDNEMQVWGAAILSKYPIIERSVDFYVGSKDLLEVYEDETKGGVRKPFLHVCTEKERRRFNFANTHFTWTPDGQPTLEQREHLEKLLDLLSQHPDIVLCGDFNAPRGGEVWSRLASIYKDNIPEFVTTTVDKNKHRAGDLQLVVDGLFSTPEYEVSNVEIVDGVSDHCAIVASIEKISSGL